MKTRLTALALTLAAGLAVPLVAAPPAEAESLQRLCVSAKNKSAVQVTFDDGGDEWGLPPGSCRLFPYRGAYVRIGHYPKQYPAESFRVGDGEHPYGACQNAPKSFYPSTKHSTIWFKAYKKNGCVNA